MGHGALPPGVASTFFKQMGTGLGLGLVFAYGWNYWTKSVIIPRRDDYYKQLNALKKEEGEDN